MLFGWGRIDKLLLRWFVLVQGPCVTSLVRFLFKQNTIFVNLNTSQAFFQRVYV